LPVIPSVCAAVWTGRDPLQGQVARRSAAAVSRWGPRSSQAKGPLARNPPMLALAATAPW